jgi:hypothetical protein
MRQRITRPFDVRFAVAVIDLPKANSNGKRGQFPFSYQSGIRGAL